MSQQQSMNRLAPPAQSHHLSNQQSNQQAYAQHNGQAYPAANSHQGRQPQDHQQQHNQRNNGIPIQSEWSNAGSQSGTHTSTKDTRSENATTQSSSSHIQQRAPHHSQAVVPANQQPLVRSSQQYDNNHSHQRTQMVPNQFNQNTPAHMHRSVSLLNDPIRPRTEDRPKLQNIVSTANLHCKLNLRDIAQKCKNAEYNPKRFAAVILRIRNPKTTALIFTSGKMVCTGAKSEEESQEAAKSYSKMIKKVGNDSLSMGEFKIQNIVGSHDVGFRIQLERLQQKFTAKHSQYEPEIFPGLIFKMQQPKVVLLIFASGKIVLTGAKTREEIYAAYDQMKNILHTYRNNDYNAIDK